MEAPPGFKDRPALVNRVLEDPETGRFAVEVCYGTSQIRPMRGVGSFAIQSYSELTQMGLYKVTRFELLTTQLLPWAREIFPHAPGRGDPILGRFTNLQRIRLEQWSKAQKLIIAALRASEDGKEDGSGEAPPGG